MNKKKAMHETSYIAFFLLCYNGFSQATSHSRSLDGVAASHSLDTFAHTS